MISEETRFSLDRAIQNPSIAADLRYSSRPEDIVEILENSGIYIYLKDLARICAYIRIRLNLM